MKMNLSVVMGVNDKATAPLKKITQETNVYAKSIAKVEALQGDLSRSMGLIDSFKQTREAMKKNALAIATAKEKLETLEAQHEKTGGSSAALTEKITKQRTRLNQLNGTQEESKLHLLSLAKHMKKAGIKMHDLDGASAHLNKRYKKQGESITQLSKKYQRLQKMMVLPRKLNKALALPSVDGAKSAAMGVTGVMASMAGFGMVISQTASELTALQRAAEDVNMPVNELKAMRLQATKAGAEAEDMDAAIKEMSLRWGEMKTLRSGAMNGYFIDTGNRQAYQDLMNAKDAGEAYQVLLREIANETDVSKQNFMADEFFGGDSEKLLAVLKGGREGFEQAKAMLEETGGNISATSIDNAVNYTAAMKEMSAIINTFKIDALTPLMGELSSVMKDLGRNMKNVEWREGAMKQVRETVIGVFNALKLLGGALVWLSGNLSTVIGVAVGMKLAMIGLNLVVMANPFGLLVVGIAAVIAGFGWLIDQMGGFTVVMDGIAGVVDSVWSSIKRMINKLPDSLIPDGWKIDTSDTSSELDELQGKLKDVKKDSEAIGLPDKHSMQQTVKPLESMEGSPRVKEMQALSVGMGVSPYPSPESQAAPSERSSSTPLSRLPYQALTPNETVGRSEVKLTIDSAAPVLIDSIDTSPTTEMDVEVGNMMLAY
ncbi:hypothetical protein [uncultured Vibrio sp.]|uniref:hypothetical protein n=1 Tax=uncultured Vibrio sp. TaxID=114054 RepID=UPI002619E31C|nr:hypothetical protein [uncultured Vibrio sp.]